MTLPYGALYGTVPHDPGGGALIGQALTGLGEGLKHVIDPNYELQKQVQAAMVLHPELGQALSNREYLNPGTLEDMGLGGRVGNSIKNISPSPDARAAADILHQSTPGDTKQIQSLWEKLPEEMRDKVAPMLGMETAEQTLQRKKQQLEFGQEQNLVGARQAINAKYPAPENESPQDALTRYGSMLSDYLGAGDVKSAAVAAEAMRAAGERLRIGSEGMTIENFNDKRLLVNKRNGMALYQGKWTPIEKVPVGETPEQVVSDKDRAERIDEGSANSFLNRPDSKALIDRRNSYMEAKDALNDAGTNPAASGALGLALDKFEASHGRVSPALLKNVMDIGGGGIANKLSDISSVLGKAKHPDKLLKAVGDYLDSQNATDKKMWTNSFNAISKGAGEGGKRLLAPYDPSTWDYSSPASQTPEQKYGPPPKSY